jgi:signal transduction histidine kinase
MSRRERGAVLPALLALGGLGLATSIGGLAIAEGPGRATTYVGASSWGAAVTVTAGGGLMLAGIVLAFERRGYSDLLALAAGLTWFAPLWIGWQNGSPLVRSLAPVIAALTFPLLLHLVFAWPEGRLPSRAAVMLVALVYAEAVTAAVLEALFRNPYLDPSCWANCSVNSFLVTSRPVLTRGLEVADRWFVAAAALLLALASLVRLVRASSVARKWLAPVLLPSFAFVCAIVAHAIAVQHSPAEDPFSLLHRRIYLATAIAITFLAAGFVLDAARRRIERRAVERLAATLGEAFTPGSFQLAFAEALGDPELQIAYPRPEGTWVDAQGRPIDTPTPRPGRMLTRLTRGDRPIAVVSHRGTLPDLERHLGASLLLGLENERLQAEVLAQIAELRLSRARIVETADLERKELERNLHDGTQQQILALSYNVRLALSAAQGSGDPVATAGLTEAVEQTQAALEELRDLAHGIYPAVLAESGLEPALTTLAETMSLAVTISGTNGVRYPPTVENAIFFTAAEALADAARRSATEAQLRLDHRNGELILIVEDDGIDQTSPLTSLVDRVGALGGTLAVEPGSLRAEIPCA